MLDDFDKQPSVSSPDGTKAVQLATEIRFPALGDKEYKFRVLIDGALVSTLEFPDLSLNIEVGWSPDSSQFFISYSDGGSVGGYEVHLYRVVGREVKESAIPSAVAARFKAKHWCEARGNNLFFLNWAPDSKIGFFVAEVYPDSDCGNEMGQVRGYAVDLLNGTVLRVFSRKETNAIEKSCRTTGVLALPSK
jgi:hypothetical protein